MRAQPLPHQRFVLMREGGSGEAVFPRPRGEADYALKLRGKGRVLREGKGKRVKRDTITTFRSQIGTQLARKTHHTRINSLKLQRFARNPRYLSEVAQPCPPGFPGSAVVDWPAMAGAVRLVLMLSLPASCRRPSPPPRAAPILPRLDAAPPGAGSGARRPSPLSRGRRC